MLTAAELTRMRADANRLLPDTATIYRRTVTEDSSGGEASDWSTRIGEVKCRLSATSAKTRAKDAVRGERIEAAEGWIVSLPVGTDVTETDRLTINDTTYEVVSALDNRSYAVNIRLIVKRV